MNEYIEKIKIDIVNLGLKASVITFGCQQNEADSEKIAGMANAMGYSIVSDPKDADLIIVNTCAVREHAEQKALSTIGQFKHLKNKNSNLIIGVCGCMVAQKHRVDQLKNSYPYVDFSFEPSSLDDFPKFLYNALKRNGRIFSYGENAREIGEGIPTLRNDHHKAWVSIMYGCNNFCSYCIVPYVRNRERSRNFKYVIEEVRELVASGVKEITLLGQNVNSYNGGCSFAELVKMLSEINGDFIIRFMTSHPKDVSDELISAMASCEKIAKHFHLPLQSGSDRVLKAMNRHYDKTHYLDIVRKLKEAIPGIALTTDIIIGFPGETDEEFEETLELLKAVRYDMIYSFIYSPRAGTPAAEMENQVPPEIKSARMQKLLDLQNQISLEKNEETVGKTLRVLVEGTSKSDSSVFSARTEANKLVHFSASNELVGKFVNVKITRAEPFNLKGEIV